MTIRIICYLLAGGFALFYGLPQIKQIGLAHDPTYPVGKILIVRDGITNVHSAHPIVVFPRSTNAIRMINVMVHDAPTAFYFISGSHVITDGLRVSNCFVFFTHLLRSQDADSAPAQWSVTIKRTDL